MTTEKIYYRRYYEQLVGFVISKVSFDEDEEFGDLFPVLHIVNKHGESLKLTLSCDEEGNAPGFAFIEEDR